MSAGAASGAGEGVPAGWNGAKARLFTGVVGIVLVLDVTTKLAIQRTFRIAEQVELLGDYVRLTYIYNPGAAFGLHLGEHSRIIFLLLSLVALAALLAMYWVTPARDRIRLAAIALVCGGAIGNLIDRVRSPRGVVDFMDVGFGTARWPVFNVADVAVTIGAIVLALSLWREDHAARAGPAGAAGKERGGG